MDEVASRRHRRFQDLTRRRVRHILLVSNLYDSFILTEDGHLNEALLRQFLELNLSQNPDLTRVSTGAQALERLESQPWYDLVVCTMHVGDMDAVELAGRLRNAGIEVPVLLLAFNNRALTDYAARRDLSNVERVFLWQGDVRILLAMVKYIEDRWNVERDVGKHGVPAVIVVEDNVRYYSSFLPVIYAELMKHTQSLLSEGLNLSQKMLRARARAKVLLATSYEEAWDYFSTYEPQVLGVISDIEFPWRGELHRRAGVELASRIREVRGDVPLVLQSSIPENQYLAESMGASFLLKGSPLLLQQLRTILVDHLGFGDFVFRMPDGREIDRAADLTAFVARLGTVPAESIAYHGERNHFSSWLKARTELLLSERLRARSVADYPTLEDLRSQLIGAIEEYRRARDRVVVADFERRSFDAERGLARIGGGSLGGKARGLAFVNRLLNDSEFAVRYPGFAIVVPQAVVLATDVFEEFLESNDLRDFALGETSDAEIESRFLAAPFPRSALGDLEVFLDTVRYPLAVRSSGLLEDSPNQPFAGVYNTFMLPNSEPDVQTRLYRLVGAVKRVFASTFSQQAKAFLRMTPYRLEEEKMAVIIQRIVGTAHGRRFYPDFAGVARSHNFYPTPPLESADGIVAVALGLGRTVVDGGACLRFCPRYPRHVVTFSSARDVLENSQRGFWALPLDRTEQSRGGEGAELEACDLTVAESDGALAAIGSTYSPDNDVVTDGLSRPGVRVVTFAPILKHELFPLAPLMVDLLELGAEGCGAPVEIEFATNLRPPGGGPPEFGFLQLRPLALSSETEELEIGHVRSSDLLCRSECVLGNGLVAGILDAVVVDPQRFERAASAEAALEVARFNAELQREARPYLLVGVGRWGSTDSFLGIPVAWNQIAGARVIVEAGFRDMAVEPSQGTHFFQNLTSCNVGYFTVNPQRGDGFIDWEWFAAEDAVVEGRFARRLRFEHPLTVKMHGQRGMGVILKPAAPEA